MLRLWEYVSVVFVLVMAFVIADMYPKYIGFVLLFLIWLAVMCVCLKIFGLFFRSRGIKNYGRTVQILSREKITSKEYKEICEKILYSIGYTEIRKIKNTEYADFIQDRIIFSVPKYVKDMDFLTEFAGEKDYFGASSAIIAPWEGMSSDLIDYGDSLGITVWDRERLLLMLKQTMLKKHKEHLDNIYRKKNIRIEDLDFCKGDDFNQAVVKILSEKYEFVEKKDKLYEFKIEDKVFGVRCLKAPKGEKISQDYIEESVRDIYEAGCKNAIIVSNGYFTVRAEEVARKLKIDLWNRDSLVYIIKSINRK